MFTNEDNGLIICLDDVMHDSVLMCEYCGYVCVWVCSCVCVCGWTFVGYSFSLVDY